MSANKISNVGPSGSKNNYYKNNNEKKKAWGATQ